MPTLKKRRISGRFEKKEKKKFKITSANWTNHKIITQ